VSTIQSPGRGESIVVDSQQPRPGTNPDEQCERSDLPASMCAHCRGLDDVDIVDVEEGVRVAVDRTSRPLTASFYGRCSGCGAQIVPGDTIYRRGSGEAASYDCEVCADG
jgi:hypothetical protein